MKTILNGIAAIESAADIIEKEIEKIVAEFDREDDKRSAEYAAESIAIIKSDARIARAYLRDAFHGKLPTESD